jgi:3-oxoacyl-[acyl-carrier-protein] synthase II
VLGDASEGRALSRAFAGSPPVAVSSVKAATGDLLGGAGALNAAVAALALHHGALPPTLNLQRADPACELDVIVGETRESRVDRALAVARGLEGQNVALALNAAS